MVCWSGAPPIRSSRASCQPLQRLSAINSRIPIFSKNPNIPRKEHTLGHPQPPQMKGIPKHRLLVRGLGSVPGVCWKFLILRIFSKAFNVHGIIVHKEKAFSVTVASEGSIPFYVIILMLTLIGNHMFTGQGCLKLGWIWVVSCCYQMHVTQP